MLQKADILICYEHSRRARPTWGQAMWVHFAAHLGSEPEMAAAVAIQGAKHALPRDHCLQPRHHRQRGFFFHQLRVIDLAGGVVENHQQVVPALVLEPAMPAAIEVVRYRVCKAGWKREAVKNSESDIDVFGK